MSATWKNEREVFIDIVAKTLADIDEEENGDSMFPRTKEDVIFSNAADFVDSLNVKELLYYLTFVKADDKKQIKEVKKESDKLIDQLMKVKWKIQKFVQKRISEKI